MWSLSEREINRCAKVASVFVVGRKERKERKKRKEEENFICVERFLRASSA